MKKTILILTILLFIAPSYSFELFNSPKMEIKNTLKKYNKALSVHDIEKIKTFYTKDYKSMDGFNLSEMEQILKKTYSAYKNIKYKTKLNSHLIN